MVRRLAVVAAALLLALATVPAVAADEHGTNRPIDMRLSVTIHWEFEPIPGCAVQTVMDGVGTATHLGRVTMHASHCPPLAPGETYHDGRMTITAANGDTLTMDYQGDPESTAPSVITGGTGRFADASGQVLGTVTFTWNPWEDGLPLAPWYANVHYWGAVSY